MRVLFGCLMLHSLLAAVMPSPWWVPNVTLLGLVRSISAAPRWWLRNAAVTGLFSVMWAVRHATTMLVSYACLAWAIGVLSRRWDVADPRVQGVLVGGMSWLFALVAAGMERQWSLPVLGLAMVHAALTSVLLPLVSVGARRQ